LFPILTTGQIFYGTLASSSSTTTEIVQVTATSTDTFTVVRGQGGTTAAAFVSGDKFELRITAASALNWETKAASGANADITSLAGVTSINGGQLAGMRNRIINGAIQFDQRNSGASTTPVTGAYVADRFKFVGSQAGKVTAQQVTAQLGGFSNSLNVTSASAYAVVAADSFVVQQSIEGLNVQDLQWGTASAKAITLSFTVSSSLTGTFGGSLQNSGATRSYPFSYSIATANTATPITITVAGDTAGTWLTTNGVGVTVNFGLGVGTTSSGAAGSWAGSAYTSSTGAVSVVGTSAATFKVTGVQFEIGSAATTFERRLYSQEFALCQRYCYAWTGGVLAGNNTTVYCYTSFLFPVVARSAPSVAFVTYGTTYFNNGTSGYASSAATNTSITAAGVSFYFSNQFNNGAAYPQTLAVGTDWLFIYSSEF
jgi:hypothetical protein